MQQIVLLRIFSHDELYNYKVEQVPLVDEINAAAKLLVENVILRCYRSAAKAINS